jgi:hypothetical protein
MTRQERQQTVLDILQNLRGLEPLKTLFWTELNYNSVNQPLSRLGWTDTAASYLTEDPLLFAGGGEGNEFHVIYARLASEQLLLGRERPVVSRLLRDHPYALFIFSNAAQDRWHFLNVKYDQETAKRRLFRRITVGPEERLRTASERMAMLDLAEVPDSFPLTIQARYDEAFDVEEVTDDFFRIFAEVYLKVSNDIAKVRGLENEAEKLAQLLLNRMLFLYFIQKKGWLNQQQDYLYSRFQKCWGKDPLGHSYYSEVLYPLFLCLSDADARMEGVGAVPFLNGGLFEESAKQSQAERLAHARLKIMNSTFKTVFDDLLERFNFTVTEDTPFDMEVAIDPEMLGKIFESLVLQREKNPDKDLRKLTGSYYTPRPIVHFMCQEALKEHLVAHLAGNDAAKAETARQKVGKLLALPKADQLDDDQARDLNKLFPETEAKMLRQAILDCRVCDPAVGSGAFPVGMLHEMIAAVTRLDLFLEGQDALARRNYDYDLKKRIIESCLYGVDIQEQAVRLCELRLWLSLIVDYQIDQDKPFSQAIREIPSLPNLSYRIARGDSLLERLFGHVVQLDQMAKEKEPKTKQLIESLQADKHSYFHEGNTAEKRRLELKILAKQADLAERLVEEKRQLLARPNLSLFEESEKDRKLRKMRENQERQLEDLKKRVHDSKIELEYLFRQKETLNRGDLDTLRRQYFQTGGYSTFIWCLDFAEVFTEKGGFDVMIANPPYVRADRGQEHLAMRKAILESGFYETLWEKWDLYIPFIERAFKMLRAGGVLQFITSDAYCHAKYAQRSQEWFLHNALVHRLDFVSDLKIFKAGVHNVLFCYRKADGAANVPLRILHQSEFGNTFLLPSTVQAEATYRLFQPDSHKQTIGMSIPSIPLGKICYVSYGLRANSDESKFQGEFITDDLIQNHPDDRHLAFVEGKDLSRWNYHSLKFLEYGTRRAPSRFSRPTFPELHFTTPKLITMRSSGAMPRTIYDSTGLIFDASGVGFIPWHLLKGVRNRSIVKSAKYLDEANKGLPEYREDLEILSRRFNLKYVLAVMNSSWAREFLRSRRRSNIHLYPDDWKALLIPVAKKQIQDSIAAKVDQILKTLDMGGDIRDLEREVDDMVSALYSDGGK